MTRVAPRLAALIVATVTLAATLTTPAPAGSAPARHPFGDPQTAVVGRAGDVVQVQWRLGMADDLALLGVSLGVLPDDRILLDGAVVYEDGDPELVQESDELQAYLLERISVEAGGEACPGEVAEVGDLLAEGAVLEFRCAAAADAAAVRVRTLTDLHPAYRTLATGPEGQRTVYSSRADTFDWSLPADSGVAAPGGGESASGDASEGSAPAAAAEAGLGRSAVLQMGGVLAGLLLLILVGAAWLRRTRATPSTKEPTS